MDSYTISGKPHMPKTPAAARDRTRLVLAGLGLREPGHTFQVHSAVTGRHLDRIVVPLPLGHYDEAASWFERLRDALPWSCRVTVVPEIGRIEIEPKG